MTGKQDLPRIPFASGELWDAWLTEHHDESDGVWLKLAKQGTGIPSVTYAEAIEVALTHGWIDGQKGKLDETYWLQRFTRRGPRSKWSKINRQKAVDLIERGAMKPAGMAEVERARADGRWEQAYAGSRTATVPDDLREALDANPAADEFFAKINAANRYAILYRIEDAKKPETRAGRIAKYVGMLAEQKTLHP
jgi:uncharacterized protein YdeI (YjbR/CyaY-like superfamily)